MKRLLTILILLSITLTYACRKKCNSVKTGSVALTENSKTYTSYADNANFTFVNEAGDEMVFTNERVQENYRICVKYLCKNTSDPFDETPCEYYEAEGIRNLLRTTSNDTLIIELVVSTENYEAESTLFYDLFSVHMSTIGPLTRGQFVASVGFTDPVLDVAKTIISEPMVEVASIDLLGKTYLDLIRTDVSYTDDVPQAIYFQKGVGVVVIELDGVLWGLE